MKKLLGFTLGICMLLSLFACDIDLMPQNTQDDPGFSDLIDDIINPIDENLFGFERLFNDEEKKTLTIKISRSQWLKLDQHMKTYYSKYGNYKDDHYVLAHATYEDEKGSLDIPYVGLRTRGNLSRVRIQDDQGNLNLSHFKISFDQTFDLDKNAQLYKTLNNRVVFGMEEIDLKYNRNYEQTFITEKYAFDLFRNFGVYAQHTTLIQLFIEIDGQKHFYGMYTVFEPIDQHFIQRRFSEDHATGNLYKALWQQFGPASLSSNYVPQAIGIRNVGDNYRPTYDLKTNKKANDTSDLVDFIHQINTRSGHAFMTYINAHFNVDMFLRYLAVSALTGNPDDYRSNANNYYLYRDPITNIWHLMPYDYDHSFGQGWDGFNDYSLTLDLIEWKRLSGHSHTLVDKIFLNKVYVDIYKSYLLELIDVSEGFFLIENYLFLYQQQKALYDLDLEDAMQQLRFGTRNISWYYQEKTKQVLSQLT